MFSSMCRPAMLVPTISPGLRVIPFENVNGFITFRPVPTTKRCQSAITSTSLTCAAVDSVGFFDNRIEFVQLCHGFRSPTEFRNDRFDFSTQRINIFRMRRNVKQEMCDGLGVKGTRARFTYN